MGNKAIKIKKILLGFGLAFGMILVATILAVAMFFMSIPEKTSHNYDIVLEGSPDASLATTPTNGLQNHTGSGYRDPFMPPAIAWSNLHIGSTRMETVWEPTPETLVSGKSKGPSPKKSKTAAVKKTVKTPLKSSKTYPAATASPEPVDLNTPEFKEPLILPGLSQSGSKYQNTGKEIKINYTVKKGETLSRISRKFGISRQSIVKENGLNDDADKLPEGKILIIPIPKNHLYKLKADETLWRIAIRYGTTVELLQEINNIRDINKLKTGQIIILPVPAGIN